MTGPLSHVRVLDLSRSAGYPGGYCTLLLADLGAEVLKVEQPGRGDALRMSFGAGPSPAHVGLNRGKRSITLDTRAPEGQEVLKRLVADADVLVETARPGVMDQSGFGYSHAAEVNPGIVWCSLTGFGQDGPFAESPGHDLTYMAQSGLLAALGEEIPWAPQLMLTVPVGAIMSVVGILAALERRHVTGKGCHIDASIAETGTWLLSGAAGLLSGQGFSVPYSPDRRLYRCADGKWVSVAAAEPRTWGALCEGLGLPELVDALHVPDRRDEATEKLEAAFAARTAAECVEKLGGAGAAVGPVNRGEELLEDPHAQARGTVVRVSGLPVPASPLRMKDPAGAVSETAAADPPELGADTDSVLSAAGYSAEEIESLRSSGVI